MSIAAILVVVLIIALLGGFAPIGPYLERGHYFGTGWAGGGSLGLILIVLIILLLIGSI